METTSVAKYIAELIGTMVLTLVGCGVVVGCDTPAGVVGTALAFGLSVVAMAYCIGRVSGCHINPAITIGMYIDKRIDAKDAVGYIVFQFIGAIIGAALLWAILTQVGDWGAITSLGQNGYGEASAGDISVAGALLVEILMTFIFVLAALGVTSTKATSAQAGIVIGLTLVLVHLMAIGLTGTSVNPARFFGPRAHDAGRGKLPGHRAGLAVHRRPGDRCDHRRTRLEGAQACRRTRGGLNPTDKRPPVGRPPSAGRDSGPHLIFRTCTVHAHSQA